MLLHHLKTSRANPHDLADLDDLAFSGFAEQTGQWILFSRRERYVEGSGRHKLWMQVGGRSGHDSAWALDVEEGDPSEPAARKLEVTLQRAGERMEADRNTKAAAKVAAKASEAVKREAEHMQKVLDALAICDRQSAARNALSGMTGLNKSNLERAIQLLLQDKKIGERPKGNTRYTEIYLNVAPARKRKTQPAKTRTQRPKRRRTR